MRITLLVALCAFAYGATEPLEVSVDHGFVEVDLCTRGDVEGRLYAKDGALFAVLYNRTGIQVEASYRIVTSDREEHPGTVRIQPKARAGLGGELSVAGDAHATLAVERVERIEVGKAAGYEQLAADQREGLTATLYRAATEPDRLFLVVDNPTDAARAVSVRVDGGGHTTERRLRVAAHSRYGRYGEGAFSFDGTLRSEGFLLAITAVDPN
jgi:hypothetical protein